MKRVPLLFGILLIFGFFYLLHERWEPAEVVKTKDILFFVKEFGGKDFVCRLIRDADAFEVLFKVPDGPSFDPFIEWNKNNQSYDLWISSKSTLPEQQFVIRNISTSKPFICGPPNPEHLMNLSQKYNLPSGVKFVCLFNKARLPSWNIEENTRIKNLKDIQKVRRELIEFIWKKKWVPC